MRSWILRLILVAVLTLSLGLLSAQNRQGSSRGKAGFGKTTGKTHHGFSRHSQTRSHLGLGGGIPSGGLGRGISTGVTGTRFFAASHSIDHDRLFLKHRHGRFLAAGHYSVSSVPPEVEPGEQSLYLKARWVPTDRGKIRFVGGWVSADTSIDALEPRWVPASWYKTGDGSQIRVSGHWVFVEKP